MGKTLSLVANLCLIANLLAATAWPKTEGEWIISTVAGRGVGDNGPAVEAQIQAPHGVAVDAVGNFYIADNGNHRIRRVDASGTITTVAGTGARGYGGDGGRALQARLASPTDVAVDAAGNLYIADNRNHRTRRVDTRGIITTVAGTGAGAYSGDGGPATSAYLSLPTGVAVDGAGNLYIADTWNHRIRRVDRSGTITTVAGTGEDGGSGDGGPAVQAQMRFPEGVAVDAAGILYIADIGNHRIRRVDTRGVITTVAGTGARGYSGDGGTATSAYLSLPTGVAVDGAGNLYIADSDNQCIRRVDTQGVIVTVAGTGSRGYSGDGGSATGASLDSPTGVAVDGAGNLYIADSNNDRIRRVDARRTIITVAGGGYSGDNGPAIQAQLDNPFGVAVDGAGNLYIADKKNDRIRRVDARGIITTVAGSSEVGFGGGGGFSGDGGPAVQAQLSRPQGVAVDSTGNLYIADNGNHRIRRVDASGTITTIAGIGTWGYSGDGGPAVQAQLGSPNGVAVDAAGNFYIAEANLYRIRRVDASGTITTIAGTGTWGYSGDGGPAVQAQLGFTEGVAVDSAGNLYIATGNRIRRVDGSGTITTIAGTGVETYGGDNGPALQAQLNYPAGLAVDSAGNLYIADSLNHRIRRVDASGIITTIAGSGDAGFVSSGGYSGDGGPAVRAQLHNPTGVAVDAAGNLYIADNGNHRIRILRPASSLPPPSQLTATPVSPSQIDLAWRDNSTNETGFKVERREEGSGEWVEAGKTAANATKFSDKELLPATVYHHRVQAFDDTTSSTYSNEAMATTQAALPPTLTRFSPASGRVGTQVTITGTDFLGATDVQFKGVSSLNFEVISMMTIRAVVPPGATSGPIRVITPGGVAVSAAPFTVTEGGSGSRLFVPVILTSAGRNNAFFTSELTLTNRGSEEATLHYTYTADAGGGSGTATDSLAPGRQKIQSNAIDYLRNLDIPIPGSGNRIGTLRVEVSGSSEVSVVTRTTTDVPDGRAGLAYPGIAQDEGFQEAVYLCGLRENRQDRSNVAVQNTGDSSEGNLTLRVTVYSGDSAAPGRSLVLPDLTLPPGGFHQYNGILNKAGFDNGYVKVERASGTAAYYAYGVINDNFNSDGSFVFPLTGSSLVGTSGQTLPVIIETGSFQSELTVTNFSALGKTVDFRFVADAVATGDDTAEFSLTLKAGQQTIVPKIVGWMRQEEVAGIGPAGRAFVGALFATPAEGDMSGIVIGARTGAPDKRGGQYSLFYNGVPYGAASIESAWIYGLQQNAENRSNLALVNTGEIDDSSITLEITIFDGNGEFQPRTKTVTLGPRKWTQENGILGKISQGYVQVRKVSGNNPFVTYGVINDGGRPGERSGDGAFLLSQE